MQLQGLASPKSVGQTCWLETKARVDVADLSLKSEVILAGLKGRQDFYATVLRQNFSSPGNFSFCS